jgi:hypothetical protein
MEIVAERNSLCHSELHFATDSEEDPMTARTWRGWTAADTADTVAAHLRDTALAQYASAPGNVGAHVLCRPIAGGVEVMTLTLWESSDSVPAGVTENHPLLVARQTIPSRWEVVDTPVLASAGLTVERTAA